MGFIIFCIFFIISYILNVFYLFNGILPLFWLPYVIFKICKKEYKPIAIMLCITAPIIWNVSLVLLGFVLSLIGLYKYINAFFNSMGAMFGSLFAIVSVILNIFSRQARQEFKNRLKAYSL